MRIRVSVLLLLTLLCLGCNHTSHFDQRASLLECAKIFQPKLIPPLDRANERRLPDMAVRGVNFTRTQLVVGEVSIIILHKTDQLFGNDFIRSRSLTDFLGDDGFICADSENAWCAKTALLTFNCHSFTLADRAGLTPRDWLQGEAGPLTNDVNPMSVLVSHYLKLYKKLRKNPERIAQLAADPCINEGDAITFMETNASGQTVFVHSGRLVRVKGENWVMSKLGESPVVTVPIQKLATEYDAAFSWIAVFK